MEKNANKNWQISRPGLYKRILLVPKVDKYQQVCYLTTCLLLVVTCYTWEVWSNATKRGQEKRSFTDAASQQDVVEIIGCAPWSTGLLGQLLELLYDEHLMQQVAKFIYNILEVYNSVPMFIPPPYLYLLLTVA